MIHIFVLTTNTSVWRFRRYAEKVNHSNQSLPVPQLKEKEVQDRIRQRDLARVLRLELALMWDRIEVVLKEVSQYCVLTQLSKRSSRMMYKTKHEIEYLGLKKSQVKLPSNQQVELLKIMGDIWLIRNPKDPEQDG